MTVLSHRLLVVTIGVILSPSHQSETPDQVRGSVVFL